MAKTKGDGTKPAAEYSIDDAKYDITEMVKVMKNFGKRFDAIEKHLEQMPESPPDNNNKDDENFGAEDKRKSLSQLSEYVFNPEEKKMLHQMTNTPPRMVMPLVIEHTVNEFLAEHAFNPDSTVLLSDIFMKWFAIIMRGKGGDLITQAMGFSQIEMEKESEDIARGLEATGEG